MVDFIAALLGVLGVVIGVMYVVIGVIYVVGVMYVIVLIYMMCTMPAQFSAEFFRKPTARDLVARASANLAAKHKRNLDLVRTSLQIFYNHPEFAIPCSMYCCPIRFKLDEQTSPETIVLLVKEVLRESTGDDCELYVSRVESPSTYAGCKCTYYGEPCKKHGWVNIKARSTTTKELI